MSEAAWTLLSRPGCGLCEEFEAELRAVFGARLPPLAVVDIDERPELRIRYGRLIPVLLDAQGTPVCQTAVDAQSVEARLSSVRDRRPV